MATPWENVEENNNDGESNRPACAACKHQRKKCKKGCPFSSHFPANKHREFAAVHHVFGLSNVSKMITGVDSEKQGKLVKSLIWEAMIWMNNEHKEHGPLGVYELLQHHSNRLEEENKRLKEQLQQLIVQQSQQIVPSSPAAGILQSCNSTVNNNYPLLRFNQRAAAQQPHQGLFLRPDHQQIMGDHSRIFPAWVPPPPPPPPGQEALICDVNMMPSNSSSSSSAAAADLKTLEGRSFQFGRY
ncbi:hypothetical protein M9H77_26015 [Catharanthus roseus]|uniref:Uncharacterized protein n=1 Tax=Catharanthus roseus TaxID=4058 RepID=A0ACC0A8H9_CATRO|nr:hypothetical protein M9H77_26015 [Catharanthus roseus]